MACAVGAAVIARHRAQAAADLAALAAAGAARARRRRGVCAGVRGGAGDADDVARCVVDGLDVVVTVEVAGGVRQDSGWVRRGPPPGRVRPTPAG